MTTIEHPKDVNEQTYQLLKENFRYGVIDVINGKEIFRVSLPRKNSKFWSSRYVIWDNLNNRKV